ncbi:MAG TPA: fibrinogen-like YCDxxxxGGGW domain-containing protein [Acidimicrobiales bacterium]
MRAKSRTITATAVSLALVGAALAGATLGGAGKAGASVDVPGDGLTQGTAGASCWGIKQQQPASTDGQYWVLTTKLQVPLKVYCDMTTDGGGWALVGRGRNGWGFGPHGQGSANAVATVPTGPAAFGPAALADTTVAGLLDGAPVSSLPDGIRLRRAADAAGSTWQEWRLHANESAWSWAFGGGIPLSSLSVDGTTYQGGTTRDTLTPFGGQSTVGLTGHNDQLRMFTWPWVTHNWQAGFSMGITNGASSSDTSYLWQAGTENNPLAFAQVWVRPEIPNSSLPNTPIPSTGFTGASLPAGLSDKPLASTWGVSGVDAAGDQASAAPGVSVMALQAIGDRIYVGGRFTHVDSVDGSTFEQSFLAAFDRHTQAWISDFRPKLDGRVYALGRSPDGQLLVGGDFTNIDGTTNSAALAELDPITGAVNPAWKANLTYTKAGAHAIVRAITVANGWIYAVGHFNQLAGGPGTRSPCRTS